MPSTQHINEDEEEVSSSSNVLGLPGDQMPLLPKVPHRSSQLKSFANILIAIVGVGVLGLPYVLMKTGWGSGVFMIFLIATLTYYCMMLLVWTRKKLEHEGFSKIASFGDLGFVVCSPVGKVVVDWMIVLCQAGFCVGYLIFIDLVDVGAMGVVMVENLMIFLNARPVLEVFSGFSMVFYGLGVAIYAFEGIGMILPLELELVDKEKFCNGVHLFDIYSFWCSWLFGV